MAKKYYILTTLLLGMSTFQYLHGLARVGQEVMECVKICAGSITTACVYGILNDLATAHLCPEYFTRGFHRDMSNKFSDSFLKRQLQSDSPARLAFSWGVLATWWMGAALSVPVLLASRLGSWPKLTMSDLIKPCIATIVFMGACSAIAGIAGYHKGKTLVAKLCEQNAIPLDKLQFAYMTDGSAHGVSLDKLARWNADGYAHVAAYGSGLIAGIGITAYALVTRYLKNPKCS